MKMQSLSQRFQHFAKRQRKEWFRDARRKTGASQYGRGLSFLIGSFRNCDGDAEDNVL